MKKKIIIGLAVFSLLFLASAVYTIATIEHATTRMDSLIKLHQVEILREHLLIQIKRAQFDLYLKNSPYARSMDTIVSHVNAINNIINTCFDCHHTEQVTGRLSLLKRRIRDYENGMSRVFTLRANAPRLRAEEDGAFRIGAELISEVEGITRMANIKLEERTQAAFQEITRTKTMLYLLVVIVPVAAIGLSAFFIRGFTRPVNELLTATRRLQKGDLEYRIEGLQDEFGEVADSFNRMAGSLKEERTRMQWTEQLVVLGEMAGGLAHEIKNPLAGIKASVEVLSCDPTLGTENRVIAFKVAEQIRRIEALIKSVLNFARPPKPQLMLVDVNSILDATVALTDRHPAFSNGKGTTVQIIRDFDRPLPEMMADPLQLQQVFLNLLLNAADAAEADGSITVRSENTGDGWVRISIADTGHGVDETLAGKIFQPFFTTKPNGTGLGLAISKGLVEQHGGAIAVQNNRDRGATFTVTLPVRMTSEVAAA